MVISSRTDTGVHALCNSAHVDIQRRGDKPPLPEQDLLHALNFHLKAEPIRWESFKGFNKLNVFAPNFVLQ